MPLSRVAALSAVLCFWASGYATAGSYLLSENQWQYTAHLGYTEATQSWDAQGNLHPIGCTSLHSAFSHSVEYGYSYYHTLFASLAYDDARCQTSRQGFSDLKLGIRGRIFPEMNDRAWEIEATVPLGGNQDPATPQVGCGAYGVAGYASFMEPISGPYLNAGGGAGVRFWQAPLKHQFTAHADASGAFDALSIWSWFASANGDLPLSQSQTTAPGRVFDCSTQAKVLRTNAELKYRFWWSADHAAKLAQVGCGYGAAITGESTSRGAGPYCLFNYVWR